MRYKIPSRGADQRGFAIIEIIIIVVLVVGIGSLAIWRIQSAKHSKEQANKQNFISGPLVAEDQLALESQQAKDSSTGAASNPTTPADSGTSANAGSATKPAANPAAPASNRPVSGGSTGSAGSTPQSTPPTGSGTSPSQPTSSVTRPTADFCKQKDGASFTNAWMTDNRSHTYQVYENGASVSKTATGTAALNYDTLQTVSVLPYLTQPSWTTCSDKAGYVMVYYKPSGSAYTYNWLVPFEHVSITKP